MGGELGFGLRRNFGGTICILPESQDIWPRPSFGATAATFLGGWGKGFWWGCGVMGFGGIYLGILAQGPSIFIWWGRERVLWGLFSFMIFIWFKVRG